MNSSNKLTYGFYNRNVNTVAKALLGKIFVRSINNKILSGIIVEVEAYDGKNDKASHSYNGITKRNKVMFGKAGHLYVYFTYGMHFCANVVTGKENYGAAVLIRAIEPLNGINLLAENRFNRSEITSKEKNNLSNGPAKFCKAFEIKSEHNGISLMENDFFIIDSPKLPNSKIVISSRIGIKKSIDLPWRYYIKDNSFVSKK